MDVNSYYLELAKSLKFSTDRRQRIDTSIEYFKQKIWGEFQDRLLEVVVFGSYSRETNICNDDEEDVDIVVIYKTRELQPDTYLKQIKTFCEDTYNRSKIYQDHPTIVIDMEHIKFEIVPSVYVSTGVVKIPAPKSKELRWVNTNPKELLTKVQTKDRNNKNLIIPVIRILKYWNTLNDRTFTSFQIEKAIIEKPYTSTTIREYVSSAIAAIEEIATNDKQKNAIKNLKEKIRRVRLLETNNFNEYIELELKKFLPFP
jgi:tRNA nucleotidyltransferase (CCA-adding enzyme)